MVAGATGTYSPPAPNPPTGATVVLGGTVVEVVELVEVVEVVVGPVVEVDGDVVVVAGAVVVGAAVVVVTAPRRRQTTVLPAKRTG
jgi:hypothetical protein